MRRKTPRYLFPWIIARAACVCQNYSHDRRRTGHRVNAVVTTAPRVCEPRDTAERPRQAAGHGLRGVGAIAPPALQPPFCNCRASTGARPRERTATAVARTTQLNLFMATSMPSAMLARAASAARATACEKSFFSSRPGLFST